MPNKNEPFVYHFDDITKQLYSGNPKDQVPFLSIRISGDLLIFQIPAGGSIQVSISAAKEFGQSIVNMSEIAEQETNRLYEVECRTVALIDKLAKEKKLVT